MNALLLLIPAALALGGLGLAGFLWAIRTGQYEDLDGAAHRILFDTPRNAGGAAVESRFPQPLTTPAKSEN